MFAYLGQIHYVYGLVMGIAQIGGAMLGSRMAIKKEAALSARFYCSHDDTTCKNAYDFMMH